jgi:hypothetical protein
MSPKVKCGPVFTAVLAATVRVWRRATMETRVSVFVRADEVLLALDVALGGLRYRTARAWPHAPSGHGLLALLTARAPDDVVGVEPRGRCGLLLRCRIDFARS